MHWYLSQLVFRVSDAQVTRQEISLRSFMADNLTQAYTLSENLGAQLSEEIHPNQSRWEFVGVMHVIDSSHWTSGTEVFSMECKDVVEESQRDYCQRLKQELLTQQQTHSRIYF